MENSAKRIPLLFGWYSTYLSVTWYHPLQNVIHITLQMTTFFKNAKLFINITLYQFLPSARDMKQILRWFICDSIQANVNKLQSTIVRKDVLKNMFIKKTSFWRFCDILYMCYMCYMCTAKIDFCQFGNNYFSNWSQISR